MGDIIAIACPHCGGRVQRENNAYFAKCPYCGSEVAFNEIKEEAQIGAYRERLDVLEQYENTDRAKRLTMQKWTRNRNIVFAILSILNFLGFFFVGISSYTEDDNWVGPGSILFLITFAGLLIAVPYFAVNYPGYNALYKKDEKFGKLKMWVKLWAVAISLLLVTAFMAYAVLEIAY